MGPLLNVLLVACFASLISAYKILIIHPTPSWSHQIPVMALTEALVSNGHEVFVVSPNVVPDLKNNYTHVDVSFSYKFFSEANDDKTVNFQEQMTKWSITKIFHNIAGIAAEQFKSESFKKFQKQVKEEQIRFDVVIVETFYTPYGCAMARLLTGNAPLITIITMATDWVGEDDQGSIQHGSFKPFLFDSYTDKMTIWQKLDNWISHYYVTSKYRYVVGESARNFFTETYGPQYGTLLDDCWSNVSLTLISSNFLYFYPRALSPNVVEVGPLHIKALPQEKLPETLQKWLDEAEVVIYFCLGSNLKSVTLPEVARNNFLNTFKSLPPGYRVLWKWEQKGKIPGQSDKILAQTWFPQQGVLAHPKVKAFITHGGLQSFQEAVHYGVPTIGIPWFADQAGNVAKMVDAGIGVRIHPHELLSFEKVKAAVDAVLFNSRYALNMKRLSEISHDFTYRALDKAVFWVEHVARHGGASHLKPSSADTTLFQFFCLDIFSVLLIISLFIIYVSYFSFKYLILKIFRESKLKMKTL